MTVDSRDKYDNTNASLSGHVGYMYIATITIRRIFKTLIYLRLYKVIIFENILN